MGWKEGMQEIREWIDNYEEMTTTSLPQYTRKCNINSRVYIQNEVVEEPVVSDLLHNLHNLYIGYILTALRMGTYVIGNKTVRDMMATVSTESLYTPYIDGTNIASDFASMSWPYKKGEDTGADKHMTDYETTGHSDKEMKSKNWDKELANIMLPSGRIIEFAFGDPSDERRRMTASFMVTLSPRALPSEVCEQIISLNFTPSIKKRWLQYKANEISFWKEFVFQMDLTKKRAKALKKDRTGVLNAILERQQDNMFKHFLRLIGLYPEMRNMANSIIILDKNTFTKACNNAHLDFRNNINRSKFFGTAYAMMLATIDPRYNRVQLYIAGIDGVSEFTFAQMKQTAKKDNMDMVEVMKAMSMSNSIRF